MAVTWVDIFQVLRICHTSRCLHALLQAPQRRLHYCRNHGSFGILAVKIKKTDWVHPPLTARSYAGIPSLIPGPSHTVCDKHWGKPGNETKSKKKGDSKGKSDVKPSASIEQGYLNMDVCVGANITKGGADPVLKEDSEYPKWLWELLEPVKSYKELDPSTKQYWRRYNKQKAHERNTLKKQLR